MKVKRSLNNPVPQPSNTTQVTPKPSGPQFDVRLNSGDRTTLKEYYTGDINGPKVILTIRGAVPGTSGYVDSTYEWTKSTGQGTWKAEHHPDKGPGIRDDGDITVTLNPTTGNYDLTTFYPDRRVKHTGTIVQVSNN